MVVVVTLLQHLNYLYDDKMLAHMNLKSMFMVV